MISYLIVAEGNFHHQLLHRFELEVAFTKIVVHDHLGGYFDKLVFGAFQGGKVDVLDIKNGGLVKGSIGGDSQVVEGGGVVGLAQFLGTFEEGLVICLLEETINPEAVHFLWIRKYKREDEDDYFELAWLSLLFF